MAGITFPAHSLLNRQGINLGTPKKQHTADIPREADEWTVKELPQQLQMPEPTLYARLKKGHIKARQVQFKPSKKPNQTA